MPLEWFIIVECVYFHISLSPGHYDRRDEDDNERANNAKRDLMQLAIKRERRGMPLQEKEEQEPSKLKLAILLSSPF